MKGRIAWWITAVVMLALLFTLSSTKLEAATDEFEGKVAVIVHKENPVEAISPSELRKYYSDILVTWPSGQSVAVFDLELSDPVRRKFSSVILGKRPEMITMEWANRRITNTAKNPPKTVKSVKIMQARVAKDKNALGYIPLSLVRPELVKVVFTIN